MARVPVMCVVVLLAFYVPVVVAETQSTPAEGSSPCPSPSLLGPIPSLPPSQEIVDKTGGVAQSPAFRGTRRVQRHHSSGSAGGDVILGGFVSALVAAVLCYIRVTRRNDESLEKFPEEHCSHP